MASEGDLYIVKGGVSVHQEDGDPVIVNGMEADFVVCNGIIVWERDVEPTYDEVEWDTAGTYQWTVPENVKTVTLCMIGGGGSGSNNASGEGPGVFVYFANGGGYAGTIVTREEVVVTPGDVITVIVGLGGQSGAIGGSTDGAQSKFDTITAAGGKGGTYGGKGNPAGTKYPYSGNGALKTHCLGTSKDGLMSIDGFGNTYWGGQAGLFDGGSNVDNPNTPHNSPNEGYKGSGGSGGVRATTTNKGGDGFIKLTWGEKE